MTFVDLALICLVAILGPALALPGRLRLSVVIGELLVGVALGATGLRLLDAADPTFEFMGSIGFALVMFVAGSHVPIRDRELRRGMKVGGLRAALVGAVSVPLGLLVADVFGTGNGLMYAVVIASSSAAMILPALQGTRLRGKLVLHLLPQVAIADATAIVLLPLAVDPANALRVGLGALAVLGAAFVVFLILRRVEATGFRERVHGVSKDRGLALELRVSLTLLFALAALAQLTHVSVMLAGFAFGLVLAAVGEPRRLAKQLFGLTEGFFAPIFFVWFGASLHLRDLAEHPEAVWLGLALGAAALIAHGAMVLTGQPLPAAVMTAAQLGVPVAAATTAAKAGVLAPGEDAALMLGALVSVAAVSAVTRPVLRRIRRQAAEEAERDEAAKDA